LSKPLNSNQNRPLPTRLNKQPIVDAIFEIRFQSSVPASSVIPGILFSKFQGMKIERLAAADIPVQIRNRDPALAAQPLARLHWEGFNVLVGDSALGLAAPFPYPGWTKFRERIINLVGEIGQAGFIEHIDRYSIKTVSLLEGENLAKRVQVDFRAADFVLKDETFNFRVEQKKSDQLILILQLLAPASVALFDGNQKYGLIIDIDGINEYSGTVEDFVIQLPARIEDLHRETKQLFFDLLTPETLDELEPVYDPA
jgi:uncharacterized protein (TIGR04255 family)